MRQCSDCAEQISEKRLKAVPHASRCVTCQGANDAPAYREPATNMERLGAAGKFEQDDTAYRRYTPIPSYGLTQAVRGGYGF